MIKLIFKNLWARRRRNGWLFLELILVTVVTWIIIDPMMVLLYEKNISDGYDRDKLCVVTVSKYANNANEYNSQADSTLTTDFITLVNRARQFKSVENATALMGYCYPSSSGSSTTKYTAAQDTSKESTVLVMDYIPGTHFFETFGFKSALKNTPQEISNKKYNDNELIFTENIARELFGGVGGQKFVRITDDNDSTYIAPVVEVIKDIKIRSFWHPVGIRFCPVKVDAEDIPEYSSILLRVCPGVSMKQFLDEFRLWMNANLREGNLYGQTIDSYTKIIKKNEFEYGITGDFRMKAALTVFFLINLCLGVIGTFWLQTKIRKEDVGIMLSFGATPRKIVKMLMGEGVVLTTLAVIIGCFLYLQYAIKENLFTGKCWVAIKDTYWVNTFSEHFLIISLLVYVIILIVVLTGIYIPARKISRISPVDALRDE